MALQQPSANSLSLVCTQDCRSAFSQELLRRTQFDNDNTHTDTRTHMTHRHIPTHSLTNQRDIGMAHYEKHGKQEAAYPISLPPVSHCPVAGLQRYRDGVCSLLFPIMCHPHWYYPGSREIGLLCKRTTRTVNSDLQKKEVEPENRWSLALSLADHRLLRTKFRRSAATRHGLEQRIFTFSYLTWDYRNPPSG